MCVCVCVGELNNLTAFCIYRCCCCLSSLMRWADGRKAFTVAFRLLRSLLLLLLLCCFDPLSRRMSHKAECQLNLPCPLCPTKASTRRSRGESRQQTNEWAKRTNEPNVHTNERTYELAIERANWRAPVTAATTTAAAGGELLNKTYKSNNNMYGTYNSNRNNNNKSSCCATTTMATQQGDAALLHSTLPCCVVPLSLALWLCTQQTCASLLLSHSLLCMPLLGNQ